jgi:hypothetical protein
LKFRFYLALTAHTNAQLQAGRMAVNSDAMAPATFAYLSLCRAPLHHLVHNEPAVAPCRLLQAEDDADP